MGLGSNSYLSSAHTAEQFKGKRNTINNRNHSKKYRQREGKRATQRKLAAGEEIRASPGSKTKQECMYK